jgi:orotidine-5'-phosphate decarboxylase
VAVKLQLACFERLGAPGWAALTEVAAAAREAGLLVIADGKRGDVPVTAAAYAQALFGATQTPWGEVRGLDADAATINPLLGADALEPLLAGAADAGAGIFVLVRTSNPGAADLLDQPGPEGPVYERIARLVADRAGRLAGREGLSGVGAVAGATEPDLLGRLRELMPAAIFLIPGVGAQGGTVGALGPALGESRASILVAASRGITAAEDPRAAAERLRAEAWALSPR